MITIAARKGDGTPFTAELLLSRITIQRRHAVMALIRDISERRRVEKELVAASEREQQRLGRDMHDTLGQLLAGLKYMARGLVLRMNQKDALDAIPVAAQVEQIAGQCIQEARRIASGLFPPRLGHEDLADSLRELCSNMSNVLGCECRFDGDRLDMELDPVIALHLYRIVQEATTNAVKHGQALQIVVRMHTVNRCLILEVMDNGVGFRPVATRPPGMGLRIMRHRASLLNGSLDIVPSESGGTIVRCTAPLRTNE